MDKQGYINFNLMLSPDKSGKADSYARAIGILDEVLKNQSVHIPEHTRSLSGGLLGHKIMP